MDEWKHANRSCSGKKTDKLVRFCVMCSRGLACDKCKLCDKLFDEKRQMRTTTTFHQIGKDLQTGVKDKARMVCDLGCPNSVIGVSNVERPLVAKDRSLTQMVRTCIIDSHYPPNIFS